MPETESLRTLVPAPYNSVTFDGGFWGLRTTTNRNVTLPIQYRQLQSTGRIDSLKLEWKPGQKNKPHEFWDSDIGKWIEAAAYCLGNSPDAELKRQVDETIDLLGSSQQPDGYLNTHFTTVRPKERWTNLRDAHELYCAGHLIEAAVAYFQATGERKLLEIMCRYVDYIDSVLGNAPGKNRGYCGHPEIELALVRLYHATGEQRYLNLAKFFIDERGQEPNYFVAEAVARGTDPKRNWVGLEYYQAHKPVRQQTDAEGHSVRQLYLLAGMIDVAAETTDLELLAACKAIFNSAANRRMYITGGVGSERRAERFTFDFDLPNETAYAETCAAISLVFAAHRLLQIEPDRSYADVMERALYNGVISGVSLAGDRFFYGNPLTVHHETLNQPPQSHVTATRQEWFGCACCPPNLARLLGSLGQYVYSTSNDALYVHLYTSGAAELSVGEHRVQIEQKTNYPWDEKIKLTINSEAPAAFSIALRIPGWCEGAAIKVNGHKIRMKKIHRGYAIITRTWSPGDRITLKLPMPPTRMKTNPKSRNNIGKVALTAGPIVYCLEQIDNGGNLAAIALPRNAKLRIQHRRKLLGGVNVIRGKAKRIEQEDFGDDLYRPQKSRRQKSKRCNLTAVPYCVWGNREVGEMRVWLNE